SFYIGHSL
ncbi:hypothetical protein CFOL_v3_24996, partial [Cephalotus follicularis]